ncbi:MAG: metal-dependent hydrolase [Armatimonadetes bacterium]|nr:metal-dependent hydrolase [Armatimonadota bacterium]
MIYDANASIGNWPFRAHHTRTAAQLIARLDEVGIDRALVGSLSAVCYRDSQAGNEELLAELAPFRPRLTPTAVLNPCYAGWERDLEWCRAQGCVGLRLYPNYHGYDLSGPDGQRLIAAATERGLLLIFVCRHEDRRQRHWLDTPDDISLAAIAAALRPHPQARFLVLDGIGYASSPFVLDPQWRERRFGLEISRLAVVMQKDVAAIAARLGEDKLVFGTGLPLKGPNSALLKLRLVEPASLREAIAATNLERLLEVVTV